MHRAMGVRLRHAAVAASGLALLSACGASSGPTPTPTPIANDQLSQILARGTLVISSDPAYPPQSFAIDGATRTAGTRCASNQLTAAELDGYDVQTAIEVAKRLGVEPCFVTPSWTEVTGGSWGDRWDLSIGSMDISRERMDALWFAQPYYATPNVAWVNAAESRFSSPKDLSGMKVGACLDCTQYAYLDGTLDLPGETVEFLIEDARIVGYDVEAPGIEDLAAANGNVDAFLSSASVGEAAIGEGKGIKALGDPLYYAYSAPAVDKSSGKSAAAFVAKLDEIIGAMHKDGTLAKLSQTAFGTDYAAQAATFDVTALGQTIP
jgi:polar amino acid transport system substrate-binding protein